MMTHSPADHCSHHPLPGLVPTARQMIVYLLALVPISLLAGQALGAGWGYAIGAVGLAAYFLRPARARSP